MSANCEFPATAESQIMVCIAFHYKKERLRYLFEVIRAFSDFHVRKCDITVMTNTQSEDEIYNIQRVSTTFTNKSVEVSINTYSKLNHPFELTWQHQRILTSRFLASSPCWTHFIYLEDDILFRFRNFLYWVEFRGKLDEFGLIPSFFRYEYNTNEQELFAVDQDARFHLEDLAQHIIGDHLFVSPPKPYCGMFIFDKKLATEYAASQSFLIDESVAVMGMEDWGVRERATAGLCWTNAPSGYSCRYMIPLDKQRSTPHGDCLLHHLPNTYTMQPLDPRVRFGRIRLSRIFC